MPFQPDPYSYSSVVLCRKRLKTGVVLLVVGTILITPMTAIVVTGQLARHREYTIEHDFSTPTKRLTPNARIRKSGDSTVSQQIWGELNLHLKLPGGGELGGNADRITVITDQTGRLEVLQVYYEPKLPSVAGDSISDVFTYWENLGTVKTASKSGWFREIEIDDYTLTIDGVGRGLRFVFKRSNQ